MTGQAHWYNEGAPPVEQPVAPAPRANAWGIAGFVVGLVSLCGCSGLLSPIALLLSVVGLFRPPRGWAVAGTIVSVIGCCLFPAGLSGLLLVSGVISVSAFVLWIERNLGFGPEAKTGIRAAAIMAMLSFHVARHGDLPTSLDDLDLEPTILTDGWGQPFVYSVDDQADRFTLTTPGKDGAQGTGDDLEFGGTVRNGQLQIDSTPSNRRGRTSTPTTPTSPTAPPPPSTPSAPASPGP